jgi:FlaA1/EpsC-like NDP-sugar epimerase
MNTGEIILLDRYESYLNETCMRALPLMQRQKLRPYFCRHSMTEAMERVLSGPNYPNVVLHMGTRKYPSTIPPDPVLLAEDNILNTYDLLEMVRSIQGQLFLMASYVVPGRVKNIMQASLMLAEHYLQSDVGQTITNTASVRLFNLVENRGSLPHRIQHQIRNGRKIILNHPDEERYFFTASSAAKFMLLSTVFALGGGGGSQGVFVSCMNRRVKITDLARFIIRGYGLDPVRDMEIQFVSSQNGEEWIDDMDLEGHVIQETPCENIRRILSPCIFCSDQMRGDIEEFRELVKTEDAEGITRKIDEALKRIQASEDIVKNLAQISREEDFAMTGK